jgi:molybdopterin molybdotransferase
VLHQGDLMRAGETILHAGRLIRPVEVGLLAELGVAEVSVHPLPSVAILATGDELVEPGRPLGPGQIWNSNGPMLAALARQLGTTAIQLGIVADDRQHLADRIMAGLRHDVLILTGGVSMGARDFVPELLSDAGVECLFHKVSMKPGKPIWCGLRSEPGSSTIVFGLPGNPVSTFVCFELFVRPAIRLLAGRQQAVQLRQGRLGAPFAQRGDRPTLFPAQYISDPSSHDTVTPLPWKGSADLRTVTEANCLVEFPAGECQFDAGQWVTFRPMAE